MLSDRSGDEGPVVSVVMPFLDAAPYIQQAAGSVLGQSWTALELLLVDDGGTDGSDQIARDLAATDPRVRVLTHAGRLNRGIGASRGLGISEARGDLVAFLDADDAWEPHHVADQVALLRAHPEADLVCGRNWAWRSWHAPAAIDVLSELAFAADAVVSGRRLLAAVLRNGAFATATCSLMARRNTLAGVIPHIEGFPGLFEDQVLNAWLQMRGTAVMSGATSAWYRMHKQSISASLVGEEARAYLRYLSWIRDRLSEEEPGDRELVELLDEAHRRTIGSLAPPRRSRRGRLLRAVVPTAARRHVGRVRSALHRLRTGAVEPVIGPEEVAWALHRHGADVRGDVLVLGDGTALAESTATTSVRVRPWPGPQVGMGPHHALAGLDSEAHDCVLLLPDPAPVGPGDLGMRHLRRTLRPAGVLLVVLRREDPALADHLRAVFGWDAVSHDAPGAPYASVLRAFVPAA